MIAHCIPVLEAQFFWICWYGDCHDRLVDERHRNGEDHRRQNQSPGSTHPCHDPITNTHRTVRSEVVVRGSASVNGSIAFEYPERGPR